MSPIDGAIVVAFAAYAIRAGWRSRREASRNLEEYFLAGRSLGGVSAGVSMAATQFAADTPLLVTGLIATAGVFGLWRLWIYAIAFLLLGFVLAPCWRRARVLTDAELAELRYSGRAAAWLRGLKAVYFGTLFNCTVLAMVLFAVKEVAQPFLRWPEWLPAPLLAPFVAVVQWVGVPFARAGTPDEGLWVESASNLLSVLLLVTVTALYSSTGGLRAVVRTDRMQFAVMMAATAAYAIWMVVEVGGLGALADGLRAAFDGTGDVSMSADGLLAFTPAHAVDASLPVLAVIALQWLVQMNADGTGYLAQRSMACRTVDDARLAAVVFTVAQVVVRSLLWLPIGLGLLLLVPPTEASPLADVAAREATFVTGMTRLPVGLQGLMLTAMLAALASTIDTHLNWGASYWTHDLYARFFVRGRLGREPSARSLVAVARLSNLGILALGLAIMTQLSSIQSAWHMSLLLGAGMGVMLVLRWLWWRITAVGEIAAVVSSAVLAPLLLHWLPDHEAARLLWMAIGATTAGIVASLVSGPEPVDVLTRFHERARPPGFWRPFDAGGEDRRRLGRDLSATALCAASIFCALVGLGTALISSPVPVEGLSRGLWVAALLATSLALVPLWWRLGFRRWIPAGARLARRSRGRRAATPEEPSDEGRTR